MTTEQEQQFFSALKQILAKLETIENKLKKLDGLPNLLAAGQRELAQQLKDLKR